MITTRTSPQYVNRVRQDWTANGGVYGDGGISALVPSNDPFAQLGPTLDLTFAGVPTDQLAAPTTDGYSVNLNLSSEIYQIAAQYVVWGAGGLTQVNFADIVTFTRASTATYFNSAGTLTSAAINEARFDYNPSTLAPLGLLIEESRTNSIRNNTMQGAVAGTPGTLPTNWSLLAFAGGLTRQIVGVGTDSGINYIDIRLSGTTTDANGLNLGFDGTSSIPASTGQTWTSSAYIAIISGSLTNITGTAIRTVERTGAGSFIASTDASFSSATSTLPNNRFSVTRTLGATAGAVQSTIIVSIASGVAIDITLRIGLPQLELGAFATSVIPTTTTALTRSADVASVNTLSPWYNSTTGTIYAEYQTTNLTVTQFAVSIDDSPSTSRATIAVTTTTFNGAVVDAGVVQATISQGTASTAIVKNALAYAVNDFAFSANGAAPATDTSGTVPSVVTQMSLGRRASGSGWLSGYLRRITYYPRRLSNADLQTLTT